MVALEPRLPAGAAVVALDLNTRSLSERAARRKIRGAFRRHAARRSRILFKKIDSTLRGHVAAELSSAQRALGGKRPVILTPAFPAQARLVSEAKLFVRGEPRSGDLRILAARAGLPAAHVDLATIRHRSLAKTLERFLAQGARAFVCDAETDADLDAIARAGLAMARKPLFAGSAGLARALARCHSVRHRPSMPKVRPLPIVTVVGSASAVSRRQARELAARGGTVVRLQSLRRAALPDLDAHYVLTGGQTARAVLTKHRVRAIRLLGEVEPGVPLGVTPAGRLVCTKAGGFGDANTLERCVRHLERAMRFAGRRRQ
jgi:4-hydroxythreonine-4-phosphate dehydrogenase